MPREQQYITQLELTKICFTKEINQFCDFHLAAAAFLAISDLFFADRDLALALPPFKPPSRPNAAAAFTSSCGVVSAFPPVAISTMDLALLFASAGNFTFFAMKQRYKTTCLFGQASNFKLTHYPKSASSTIAYLPFVSFINFAMSLMFSSH